MSVFLSTNPVRRLDSLQDVSGFSAAVPGVPYSFLRATPGGSYKPTPTLLAGSCAAPTGGLEKTEVGCLAIKPDTASGDSGVGLTLDGLEIVGRVRSLGDQMTGGLLITEPALSGPASQYAIGIVKGDGSTSSARGIRVRAGTTVSAEIITGTTFDGTRAGRLDLDADEFRMLVNDGAGSAAATPGLAIGYGVGAPIKMHSRKLIEVTDPTDPQDAATKAYVDGMASLSTFTIQASTDDSITALDAAVYDWGTSVTPSAGRRFAGPVLPFDIAITSWTATAFQTNGTPATEDVELRILFDAFGGAISRNILVSANTGSAVKDLTGDPQFIDAGQRLGIESQVSAPSCDVSTVLFFCVRRP